ncbi:MAG: hypothetical protein C4523_02345 [Myxococcales bacterium]|nr:MAG: hypothetical protein C4523_02345 [Myxococcales bacterium]
MTRRQRELWDFIRAYWQEHGMAPTYDTMATGIGLRSKSQVFYLIKRLEDRGHVRCVKLKGGTTPIPLYPRAIASNTSGGADHRAGRRPG